MQPSIYADLRCLQDLAYRHRGIGHHVAALLRTRGQSAFSNWKTIGLIDSRLPNLPPEFGLLVDEISSSVNPSWNGAPAVFIDGSPMTHETRFNLRFQNHPGFLRAAVLYDFIPLDWPGYLSTVANRIDYVAKLARLRTFNLFFPISEYTAWRLSELLGITRSRINVTGASVRRTLYEFRDALGSLPSPYERSEPYFVTLGGGDARKNTELAVAAVRRLNLIYARRIPLKIIGHYGDAYKRDLLRLAGDAERGGFLEFHAGISDKELVSLFAGAVAAIAPSHIEGFSLPVVEASVCGCPVMVSTCAAHMELITETEALFLSDDSGGLSEKLDALLTEPARRASLAASQAHIGAKFHEELVGRRFWSVIEVAVGNRLNGAVAARPQRPRLAFLSPYPPDESGVARYTANTLRGGEKLFHTDLYTDAPRPLTFEGGFRDAGPVTLAPLVTGRYHAIISVLGNSPYHTQIFEFFERYGGPCILHDARLTHIYFHRLGQEKFLEFAAKLLGRSVSMEEVSLWLQDRNMESLFVEPIIERAAPLIVHTASQQAHIKKAYGADAQVTTFCPNIVFGDDELTTSGKRAARERQGVLPNCFLISTFGYAARAKGMDTCILAIELLRSWDIPAELYFVGNGGPVAAELDRLSALYGIAQHVHCSRDFVHDATYRNFLVASDAGIHLRTYYGFGQLSAGLTDSISAGLPCVANYDLATCCDAPDYIRRVPDRFSPLQVAEQLAVIWETQAAPSSRSEARAAYLKTHNFEYYGKRLIEILGFA